MASLQLQTTLAAEEQKLLACIHCGLCLEACPTYVVTGDENDGPRGRLYLMRAVGEGRLSNQSASFKNHIDRCLGCRACEQVCPAGVQYGQLLEAARSEIVTAQPPKGLTGALLSFALRRIWPKPARLRLFFATSRIMRDLGVARLLVRSRIARLFSKRVEFALALVDTSRPRATTHSHLSAPKQTAEARSSVLLFSGCVGEGLFAHVNRATERVLRANGFEIRTPQSQVCCGALHAHAGDLDGARELARQNISAFGNDTSIPIITNAGGCGAMLSSYGHLLAAETALAETAELFSSRVKDVAQQLDHAQRQAQAATADVVTYDASCHLLYGQHAADASLRMLQSIDDLNFVGLRGSERCCGGAGIYNLLQPELSGRVLSEKLTAIEETGASVVTTGNAGCQMQIGAGAYLSGMKLNVRHPVELLDECYARAGLYTTEQRRMSLNRITLAVFAPILILAGIAGFLVPPEQSLTSGAPAYNVFHLIFGAIGLLILFLRSERAAITFNVGFGLIDLYQALASLFNLTPKEYFVWTRVDDVLHVVIGLGLVVIGTYGMLNRRKLLNQMSDPP